MGSRRKKKTKALQASPAMAVLLTLGCFALFSVLFRYEVPRVDTAEHKNGRISLYPVAPGSADAQWLDVHEPSRIARGGEFPEPEPRQEPANAPKPEPVVSLKKSVTVAPEPIRREQIPSALPPVSRQITVKFAPLPKITQETYPRITVNGRKYDGYLPEALLKQSAAVNAGTVELRFSKGIPDSEIRVAVLRSSGNSRVDQALAGYFARNKFQELPAVIRTVWDAAGEVEK